MFLAECSASNLVRSIRSSRRMTTAIEREEVPQDYDSTFQIKSMLLEYNY